MTPLMRQYHTIKEKYPDELILFQVGDFYELFYDDARKAANHLGIVLTQRGMSEDQPIPLCGFPCHNADYYIMKLVAGGFRIVVCDQLAPTTGSKLIERVVSRVLTPGTLIDAKHIDAKSAVYLAILVPDGSSCGLVFVEILTGTIYATVTNASQIKLVEAELARFVPSEVVLPLGAAADTFERMVSARGYTTMRMEQALENDAYQPWLAARTVDAVRSYCTGVLHQALTLMYAYLYKHNPIALEHIHTITLYQPEDFLIIDAATQRNLELIKNSHEGSRAATLWSVLDQAATSMGSRRIKQWLLRPLVDKSLIEQRLQMVQMVVEQSSLRSKLIELLRDIGDIERAVGRIALRRAQIQDYVQLLKSMERIPALCQLLDFYQLKLELQRELSQYERIATILASALNTDPNRDWIIQAGYHEELDRLRGLIDSGAQAVLDLERKEQQATGISSLKIRFNQVHGYGIEITKSYIAQVPPSYMRVQTLVNRERFTTQALKDLEYDIRRAQTDSKHIEKELFEAVCQQVAVYLPLLQRTVQDIATLDGYIGFAQAACDGRYIRPTIVATGDLIIRQGRHPVVESTIRAAAQGQFIANDLMLNNSERVWIITGPNMGGKSTFLRQSALIVLMAQAGSFVPAAEAQIPIVDRIFTRIGASDHVALGKSTFWVEMEETALICQQATARSFVILDEVGRGTSTYDGLAIAQAVVEYIAEQLKARCLFATHYHELTQLVEHYTSIATHHAVSKKTANDMVLLHQIRPGVAQGSFGIDVARNAQLPAAIVTRAEQILKSLQKQAIINDQSTTSRCLREHTTSDNFYEQSARLINLIQSIDIDEFSPRQAHEFLGKLKEVLQ